MVLYIEDKIKPVLKQLLILQKIWAGEMAVHRVNSCWPMYGWYKMLTDYLFEKDIWWWYILDRSEFWSMVHGACGVLGLSKYVYGAYALQHWLELSDYGVVWGLKSASVVAYLTSSCLQAKYIYENYDEHKLQKFDETIAESVDVVYTWWRKNILSFHSTRLYRLLHLDHTMFYVDLVKTYI